MDHRASSGLPAFSHPGDTRTASRPQRGRRGRTALILAFGALSLGAIVASRHPATVPDGVFETGLECMCGHSIFVRIEGDSYRRECPGHREVELLYTLQRVEDGWLAQRDATNVFRIRVVEGRVLRSGRIGSPQESTWNTMDRVINPSRVWLPWLLGG